MVIWACDFLDGWVDPDGFWDLSRLWFPRQLSGCASRALGIYQRALSLNTPSIAAQAAISAQNAMAWNEYGDLVCRTRRGRGAHRLRRTNTLRNLTITDDSSFRHTEEKLPNSNLE